MALVENEFPYTMRENAKFHSPVRAAEKSVILSDFNWAVVSKRSSSSKASMSSVWAFDFDISSHVMQCFTPVWRLQNEMIPSAAMEAWSDQTWEPFQEKSSAKRPFVILCDPSVKMRLKSA